MTPFWISAFLDLAPDEDEPGVAFWQGVTGYGLSEPRGEHGEFATLVPPDGDDFLRVQRLGSGPSRIHLDLHVDDPAAAATRAPGSSPVPSRATWCSSPRAGSSSASSAGAPRGGPGR